MSSLHVILPSQYLQRADAGLAAPQKRLMIAVLEAVLHDSDAAALAYVENRDRSWPFSFENICDTIGLDAGNIRRALQRRVHDAAS